MRIALAACALPVVLATGIAPGAPVPVSAPAADSMTSSYSSSGIRVIHRRTNTSIVVANLYLLGGVRRVMPHTAGIENLLLQITERGTQRYPRDVLRRAMARTGSEIIIEPRTDWTLVGVRTTVAELDSTWAIFADRIAHPTLDSTDVEFIRDQMVTGVRQRADSPDATLDYLADSIAFAGSAYALPAVGTERSLSSISNAELKAFHRDQFVTSRMLLVVVGDVTREKVDAMIRGSIGRLPAGNYEWTMPDTLATTGADAVFLRRPLPTNYLQAYMQGPPANSADVPAVRVASAVLAGRLFTEIRSKRNLTYAVSANFRDRALSSVGLYVTTTTPDTTLSLMQAEIRSLQVFEIQTELLRPIVQQFITEYFLDNETSTAQADFLARAQLYRGDYRAGDRFVAELRTVSGADVRRVVRRYFRNPRWAYVGDPSRVRRDRLLQF